MKHVHGAARWKPEPRCAGCGHRVMREGIPPRQTRELPAVLWPFEVAGRIEARIRGRLARTGRLPL